MRPSSVTSNRQAQQEQQGQQGHQGGHGEKGGQGQHGEQEKQAEQERQDTVQAPAEEDGSGVRYLEVEGGEYLWGGIGRSHKCGTRRMTFTKLWCDEVGGQCLCKSHALFPQPSTPFLLPQSTTPSFTKQPYAPCLFSPLSLTPFPSSTLILLPQPTNLLHDATSCTQPHFIPPPSPLPVATAYHNFARCNLPHSASPLSPPPPSLVAATYQDFPQCNVLHSASSSSPLLHHSCCCCSISQPVPPCNVVLMPFPLFA